MLSVAQSATNLHPRRDKTLSYFVHHLQIEINPGSGGFAQMLMPLIQF